MTEEQMRACRITIHGASALSAAVGAGLAQIPISDNALLVPLQITMIVGLGRVFGVQVTDSAAMGLALGLAGMYVGRATSQILTGWIPVFGNFFNATTAMGITEAIGWAVVKKLDKGEIGATTK